MIGLPDSRQVRWVPLAVSCLLLALGSCGNAHIHEVYAIEATKTYHRENCAPVHMAKAECMTIAEAKARNFKPCPVCKPDSQ